MSVYSNNQYGNASDNSAWHKIFKFIPAKSRILDIGCSSGALGIELKKSKGAYVVGVDIDESDLALAKKNLDQVFLLNVEKDELAQLGKFDVIIMADVIEHLVDPVSALIKIKKLLSPKGRLVFSIPNMANVTTRVELIRGRFEYKDFGLLDRTHLHFYDHTEIDRVFYNSGLDIKDTDCTLRIIPDPILKKYLNEVGIDLTPKLKKHLQSTDANIFQFIGYAQPSGKVNKFAPKTTSPLDVISMEIDAINQSNDKDKAILQKSITKLESDLKIKNQELTDLYESKAWKSVQKYRQIRNKLKS